MDILLVFPGWASTRTLYENLELDYDKFIYADTFDLSLIEKKVRDTGYEAGRDRLIVLAWSMGTLQAQKFISKNWVDKLILASPTNEFCLTTRPVIVKRMIKGLKNDKEQCLKEFLSLNFVNEDNLESYLKSYFEEICTLDEEFLIDGLQFLLDEKIESYNSVNRDLEPFVVMAKNDQVISKENSDAMLEKISGAYTIQELECGHNIFYEAYKDATRLLRGYLDDN